MFPQFHFQSYQVVRVIRTVRRGEEVSIDYGFDFYANPLEVRQKRANSQYHFSCKCVACVNNWPTYNDLVRCLRRKSCFRKNGILIPSNIIRNDNWQGEQGFGLAGHIGSKFGLFRPVKNNITRPVKNNITTFLL